MSNRAYLLATVIILSLLCGVAMAQTKYYDHVGVPEFTTTVPTQLGFINPLTGTLHIEIPLASIPQRNAPPATLKYTYDTILWDTIPGSLPIQMTTRNGWKMVMDYGYAGVEWDETLTECSVAIGPSWSGRVIRRDNFRVVEKDGTAHVLRGPWTLDYTNCSGPGTPPPGTPTLSGWIEGEYFIQVSNYLRVKVQKSNGDLVHDDLGTPSIWQDSNGNRIVQASVPNSFTTFTDTLGKVPITGSCSATGCTITVRGASDGASQVFTISNQTVPVCTNFGVYYDFCGSLTLLSSISLPNGTQYSFTYDSGSTPGHYGVLTGVTLPTGGQITYSHTLLQSSFESTKRLHVSSATESGGTRNFSYTFVGSYSTSTRKVVGTVTGSPRFDIATATTVNDKTVFTSTVGTLYPQLAKIQSYSGPTTLKKTTDIAYTAANSNLIRSITTTLNDTGQQSNTQYSYAHESGQPDAASYAGIGSKLVSQVQESDFSGAIVRTKKQRFLTTYISSKILNRPASVSIYAGNGSSGNPASQTTYAYDEYTSSFCSAGIPTLTSVAGATGHDDSGHGVSFTVRGNATTINHLISGTTYATSHVCYDTLGNARQEVDPGGHHTTYDYTDNWADTSCIPAGTVTHAFPTTITNELGHRVQRKHYSCTGLVQSTRDENDILASRLGTTFTYDLMNRSSVETHPDGGQISNTYTDAAPQTVQRSERVTDTLSKVVTTEYDGYGRLKQTRLSDPDSPDVLTKTDTAYDASGRTSSESNPYRSMSQSTDGITYYYYDALGRTAQVKKQDGGTVNTTYLGNCAIVIDEVGKKRKSCMDAFGRLTNVWEDPDLLNYETVYQYDLLDNPVRVDQKGGSSNTADWRTRTFTYNARSQLVCSANPELNIATCPATDTGSYVAGTIRYTYDTDGNVLTKISPKPNQPSPSVSLTTTYQYDQLHRLLQKSYNDGSTATAYHRYDGSVAPGGCVAPTLTLTNKFGRRTLMCDSSGATGWAYDEMGRVLTEARKIDTFTGNTSYAYNDDGSLWKLTYPSGRTVTYTPNSSGTYTSSRPVSAVDQTNNINYVTSAKYAPHGALTEITLGFVSGGFAGIKGRHSFNSRLQPLQMAYTTGTVPTPTQLTSETCPSTIGTVMHRAYDFDHGLADNGNVVKVNNCRDLNRSPNYFYDRLNRIQQAYTTGTLWGETFTIDSWGNLTNIGPVAGKTNSELLNAPATTQNRLTGFSYDAAGNMLNPPGVSSVTYDAESRVASASGWSYTYDGDGKRVKKSSGSSGKLYWTGIGGDVHAESNLAGTYTAEYVFLNGSRAARRDLPGGSVYYYFGDHLGSTVVLTNATGTAPPPLEASDYYPFGGEIVLFNGDSNVYKFTGKERDTETGLDYFGARHHASALGRLMSLDPMKDLDLFDPQKLNRYAYGRNNPLSYVDVGGRCVAPALGKGQVGICVESYIRAARLGVGKLGLGDNRGPVANDSDATFRSQTLITVDLNSKQVSETTTAGTSDVFWKGILGFTGTVNHWIDRQSVDADGNTKFTVFVFAQNGHATKGNPVAPQGWIEIEFTFVVDRGGNVRLVKSESSTKKYPSISVYSYSQDGKSKHIFEQEESGNDDDLNKPKKPLEQERERQCRLGNPSACNW
jgi:RHS repeat-associated protein